MLHTYRPGVVLMVSSGLAAVVVGSIGDLGRWLPIEAVSLIMGTLTISLQIFC